VQKVILSLQALELYILQVGRIGEAHGASPGKAEYAQRAALQRLKKEIINIKQSSLSHKRGKGK
jgi:hypothetical protein